MIQLSPAVRSREVYGIIVPLVTPLLAQDTLDIQGLERLIDHVLLGGVHAVYLLGGCGEGPSLSTKVKRELVSHTCKRVRGRVPILVGITDCAFAESVALAEHAHEVGADGLVVAPPHYYLTSQSELASFVRHLHHELRLPMILQNAPAHAPCQFEMETLACLLDLPLLSGICVAGRDSDRLARWASLLAQHPTCSLLVENEAMLDQALQGGASGVLAEGANLFPELFVGWYDAIQCGDSERACAYQSVVQQLESLYRIGSHASTVKSAKAGLSYLNICGDLAAEPFQPLDESENAVLAAIIEGIEHQLERGTHAMSYI